MAPFRLLCLGVLALAAAAAPRAPAQESPTSADAVGEAIATIKGAPSGTVAAGQEHPRPLLANDVEEARATLISQRDQSVKRVLDLLSDSNVQTRLNAAIILSGMADAGDKSPAVMEGLQRCVKDSAVGVAYLGFEGLMADIMPAEVQRDVLTQIINVFRPRPLRLAAIPTILEKKPKAAVPVIIVHLQNILKDYKSQVETELTAPPTQPGQTLAPVQVQVFTPVPEASSPDEQDIRVSRGGRRGEGPRGGMRRGLQGQNRSLAAPTPGSPRYPGAGQGPAATRKPLTPQDLDKLPPDQVGKWIPTMESLPAVQEVHLMGWTLEELIRTAPDEKLFGFDSTAPWDLDRCVEKAVAWLKEHKAEYPQAPAAPKPEAAVTPAVAPAAEAAPTPAVPPAAEAAPTPAVPPATEAAPTPATPEP